jgi:hypothetical protein
MNDTPSVPTIGTHAALTPHAIRAAEIWQVSLIVTAEARLRIESPKIADQLTRENRETQRPKRGRPRKVARPERFELPTFWFVASHGQNPNGLFGVAYESENAF